RINVLRSELKGVPAMCFAHVIADRVCRIRMPPRHVSGINCKTPAAVSRIRAKKHDTGYLAAETVVEDVAHSALRNMSRGINADHGITLSGRCRIGNQRLVQRRVTLELSASSVLVGEGY